MHLAYSLSSRSSPPRGGHASPNSLGNLLSLTWGESLGHIAPYDYFLFSRLEQAVMMRLKYAYTSAPMLLLFLVPTRPCVCDQERYDSPIQTRWK